jgi:hypothetical protein
MTLSRIEADVSAAPAPARSWRRTIERVSPLILVATLIVLWQVLVRFFEVPAFLLPAPTDIVRLMIDEWPLIQMHTLSTIWSITSGYIAATLFALFVSAVMIRYPLAERLIMPIFVGLQSVPKIAIAPLILVWVGAGAGSKVLVVASIAFFPIVINTMAGFKEVDRGLSRRVPLGRRHRTADVLSASPALRDTLYLRRASHCHHAFRPRRHCRRVARGLEWSRLSRPVGQFQLQYRALIRGDHHAGTDRHDLLCVNVVA